MRPLPSGATMNTMTVPPNNIASLYEVTESFATAITDMLDKAKDLLLEQKNISLACKQLDQLNILLEFLCDQIEKIDSENDQMPLGIETGFRHMEDTLLEKTKSWGNNQYDGVQSRLKERLEKSEMLMHKFFNILREKHFSATEEDLTWYHANRSGTLDHYRTYMKVSVEEAQGVIEKIDSNEHNTKLSAFFQEAMSSSKNINIH